MNGLKTSLEDPGSGDFQRWEQELAVNEFMPPGLFDRIVAEAAKPPLHVSQSLGHMSLDTVAYYPKQ